MRARALILAVCMTLGAVAAMAHGGEEHVMGTVTKVAPDAITVKTTAGPVVTVSVVAATTFAKGKTAAKLADLSVGDRVVIHAKEPEEGKLVADTVEFTAPKAAVPATGQSTPPKPAPTHSAPATPPNNR